MKKTYIIPSITTVQIAPMSIIAASDSVNFDGQGGGTVTTSNKDASGAAMSRGQNGGFGSGLWSDMK